MSKEVPDITGTRDLYVTAGHRYLAVVCNSEPIGVRATSGNHTETMLTFVRVELKSSMPTVRAPPHPALLLCILRSARTGGVGTASQDISSCNDSHMGTGKAEGSIPWTVGYRRDWEPWEGQGPQGQLRLQCKGSVFPTATKWA